MIESRSSGGRCGGGAVFATQSAEARVSGTSAAFTEPRLVCGWPYNGSRCGVRPGPSTAATIKISTDVKELAPPRRPAACWCQQAWCHHPDLCQTSTKHLTSCSVKSTIPSNRSVLADTVPATTCNNYNTLHYLPISLPMED